MIIKNLKDYIDKINEGLIKTYSCDIVLKNIINRLELFKLNVHGECADNKLILTIEYFNTIPLNQIENIFDQIHVTIVNQGGWFPSFMKLKKLTNIDKSDKFDLYKIIEIHDELKSVTITFESKFDDIDYEIPNKLYHLTIKEYSKKIKKNGLVPRSKSKLTSHLDRVYLCKTYQDCIDLIPQMMFYYTGEKDRNIYRLGKKLFTKDITPIIYEIDNSDGFIDKFYKDVNYNEKRFYTLENIPPNKIKLI